MKRIALFLPTVLLGALALSAQNAPEPQKPVVPCLIVSARAESNNQDSTTSLFIGQLAGAFRYDYVDSARVTSTKLVYKGLELRKLHTNGTHIVVLPGHYSPGELQMAKRACEVTDP